MVDNQQQQLHAAPAVTGQQAQRTRKAQKDQESQETQETQEAQEVQEAQAAGADQEKNPWQLYRAGIFNFWYYDEEEFFFADGKLLLRGANSSGKSVTMQSLIPVLLDGRKSPDRLDPFGSRSRKMEDYLLGEAELVDREERTGYLYLEYKRRHTEQYLTTGMGLRARRHGSLDFWGFVLKDNRRIGTDLQLYKTEYNAEGAKEKIPLTRPELENRIGEGGRVVRTQADYMDLVNRHIFGFSSQEAYEELIKLLIQLRSPKLSKDFRPTVIYDILNESLPPISGEELRPLSDIIESMDQTGQQIEQLEQDKKSVERICRQYSTYNCYVLAEKASKLLHSLQDLKKWEKKGAELVEEETVLCGEIEKLKQTLLELKSEESSLQEEQSILSRHKVFEFEKEKIEKERLLQETKNLAGQKDRSLSQKSAKEQQLREQIRTLQEQQARSEEEVSSHTEDLAGFAEQGRFAAHEQAAAEFWRRFREEYHFDPWRKEAGAYRDRLEKLLKAMEETARLRERYQDADRELGEARRELDEERVKEKEWYNLFLEERDKLLEAVHRWRENNRVLHLETGETQALSRYCSLLYEEVSLEKLREPLQQAYLRHQERLGEKRTDISHRLEQKKMELEEKAKELESWRRVKDPEPQRHLNTLAARAALDQEKVPYLPFFAAVEFNREVPAHLRERLESVLAQMGLLDALVVPQRSPKRVYRHDRVIHPAPCYFVSTLADYLYPTPVEGVAVEAEDIDVVLRSILVEEGQEAQEGQGERKKARASETKGAAQQGNNARMTGAKGGEADEKETAANPAISKDGVYRISLLHGHAPDGERSRFIGREARRMYREREMARLQGELYTLHKEWQSIQGELQVLTKTLARLQEEFGTFPSGENVHEAFNNYREVQHKIGVLQQNVEQKDNQVKLMLEKLQQSRSRLRSLAEDLPFGDDEKENCRQALAEMQFYLDKLQKLEILHNRFCHTGKLVEQQQQELQGTQSDIDGLSQELRDLERKAQGYAEILKRLEQELQEMGAEEIRHRIDYVDGRLREIPEKISDFKEQKGKNEQNLEHLRGERARVENSTRAHRELAEGWQEVFAAELGLELVTGKEELFQAMADMPLDGQARKIKKHFSALLEQTDREKINDSLRKTYFQEQGLLVEYRPRMEAMPETAMIGELPGDGHEDESLTYKVQDLLNTSRRMMLVLEYDGKGVSPYTVLERLRKDIELQRQVLSDKDRELYEEIIMHSVGRIIRGRISRAEQWVKQIDQLMSERNTSSGLTFSLSWRPRAAEWEQELDTRELVELLRRDPRILKEQDFNRIIGHFRSKIERAREALAERGHGDTFHQLVREMLDYRQWFSFTLYYRREGRPKKELTNHVFNTFSGGEKAMAMYIPLFSAAYSRYLDAGTDAPFIISLDEAFAGVDEQNIRDMFDLLEKLGFNYLINSQYLWGDYDTVPALSICELIRPQEAPFVSVARYLWNGRTRRVIHSVEEFQEALAR